MPKVHTEKPKLKPEHKPTGSSSPVELLIRACWWLAMMQHRTVLTGSRLVVCLTAVLCMKQVPYIWTHSPPLCQIHCVGIGLS